MLQENTKNRMDTESKEHRFIWSNTAKGEYLAETDRQKTRTVWAHMQNAQQQEDKGADVWKNGGHKQERKTTQGMARRHYQVGRDVASETESDSVGQRNLEEVDETGIGHLRALSPWLLMMNTFGETEKIEKESLMTCNFVLKTILWELIRKDCLFFGHMLL